MTESSIAVILERLREIDQKIDSLINGESKSCIRHDARIGSLERHIKWLWGCIIAAITAIFAAFMNYLTGGK